jgi:hypothetical protein
MAITLDGTTGITTPGLSLAIGALYCTSIVLTQSALAQAPAAAPKTGGGVSAIRTEPLACHVCIFLSRGAAE